MCGGLWSSGSAHGVVGPPHLGEGTSSLLGMASKSGLRARLMDELLAAVTARDLYTDEVVATEAEQKFFDRLNTTTEDERARPTLARFTLLE